MTRLSLYMKTALIHGMVTHAGDIFSFVCLGGHQDVGILDGGLSQWLKDDLPVTADTAIPTLSSFQPSIKMDFLATLKDMIIYCFKGARAANTYIALKLAVFKHVRNYYGSWNEWSRHHELPIDDEKLAG